MPILVLLAGGAVVGAFGSLLGLGGGLLLVPLLTFGFDVPIGEAVGISLVCVIMTSSASAAVYLERRVANLRLGVTLELATASGAMGGAMIAFAVPERGLAGLFALTLVYVAVSMVRRRAEDRPSIYVPDGPTVADEPKPFPASVLNGPGYRARRLGLGLVGSAFAGVVSALLGVGGGIVKVPLMNVAMGVPLRVATGTSNMMIGVTAAAGAIVYLARGGIDPVVAAPTAIGVFAGASVASRVSGRIDARILRVLFVIVTLYTAVLMAIRATGL
ncbi:MAG TPA: sulfite exporter TauE/SafE family protein [Candidatus Limnocylindrales bacterium]|nr:sulfite exporter TauE/SafE family protein [Candidatus Limnocylindrales bacterium]